ncbi:MAG: hypothetical protein GYA57_02615 [Myxococcales bacterium]|nr:hypothetical protein [Myxococcales bacterium]
MEFTFWENKSIQLPKGPLWGSLGFLGGVAVLAILGTIAGGLVEKKVVKSNAPTLQELEAWEKTIASKDVAKIDELLAKEGSRIGADLSKWALVSKWQNDVLMDLYQSDLLINIKGQLEALKKQIEAEKAKAAAAAAGGEAKAPAPAKP